MRLDSSQLMNKIIEALDRQKPLAVVSVGQTEAFVMAQYAVFSEKEFMNHREAYNANRGEREGFFHRGIRFPNRAARNETIEAVKKADIVGYNTIVEPARSFTEKVFQVHGINPRYTFEANIRRVAMFSQKAKFEEMIGKRRILLVSSLASAAKKAIDDRYGTRLGTTTCSPISIYEHEEVPRVKEAIARQAFDLCLLAAGVNAVILASFIAESLGKVAFDIGWGMQGLIQRRITSDAWVSRHIGIENLFKM